MWKPVIAATAALALIGSTLVYAQQQQGRGHRPINPDRFARVASNARIATIKAGLELDAGPGSEVGPGQQALEDLIQYRVQRMQARQAAQQQQAGQTRPGEQSAGASWRWRSVRLGCRGGLMP